MLARLPIFAVIAGMTAYGQWSHPKHLTWTGPGGCIVEFVKTPCRTIRYREWPMENHSWGLHNVTITSTETVEAVDRRGSESRTNKADSRKYWFVPKDQRNITVLLLRPQDEVAAIDHDRRLFEVHRGANRKWPYWEQDDEQCTNRASHYLYLSGRLPDSTVAGIHAVGYDGRDYAGAYYQIYFAPSIGCQPLRTRQTTRNWLGLPTSMYLTEVDSYELGSPNPSLFNIPAYYNQVTSILSGH